MKKLSFFIFLLFFGIGFAYKYYTYSPIPKIIHYVWLGKQPLPHSVRRIIKTWEKNAPDYQIIRWDEKNCDIDANHYVKWAYKQKLWAFASDWCRFNALYKYGGLYLDTDHELTKDPSHLFRHTNLVLTYEKKDTLSGSFIATSKGHPFIKNMLNHYRTLGPNTAAIPHQLTHIFTKIFSIPLNGQAYKSKEVSLLPTNIAMLDLGGPENIAVHHYDGTDSKYKNGIFYTRYIDIFLKEMAHTICLENTQHFLIPIDKKNGYLLETKEKIKIIHKTDQALSIEKAGKPYHLQFKNDCYRP